MKEWYCYVGGRRYGPISEDVLRQWAAEGRLRPTDQVWTEGMAEWAPARTVEGIFPPGAVGPPSFNRLLSSPPPGGTGGQTSNGELTRQARRLLRGHWGLPIGFSLLLGLLSAAAGLVLPDVGPILVTGALALGGVIFYLTFVRRGDCQLGMLFAGFKAFGVALGAYVLILLFILLWSLPGMAALVIGMSVGAAAGRSAAAAVFSVIFSLGALVLLALPIVAALAYSQAFYLIADNPSSGPLQAIRRSKEIMKGRKGKLFCLGLRFLCWWLLVLGPGYLLMFMGSVSQSVGVLVLSIIVLVVSAIVGTLFLMPYISVSYARFYDDLREPAAAGTVQQLSGSAPMAGPQA